MPSIQKVVVFFGSCMQGVALVIQSLEHTSEIGKGLLAKKGKEKKKTRLIFNWLVGFSQKNTGTARPTQGRRGRTLFEGKTRSIGHDQASLDSSTDLNLNGSEAM